MSLFFQVLAVTSLSMWWVLRCVGCLLEVICVVCPSSFETWHNPVCYKCGLLLVRATLALSLHLNAY